MVVEQAVVLSRSDESIPYNGDLGGVLSNAQGESTVLGILSHAKWSYL